MQVAVYFKSLARINDLTNRIKMFCARLDKWLRHCNHVVSPLTLYKSTHDTKSYYTILRLHVKHPSTQMSQDLHQRTKILRIPHTILRTVLESDSS